MYHRLHVLPIVGLPDAGGLVFGDDIGVDDDVGVDPEEGEEEDGVEDCVADDAQLLVVDFQVGFGDEVFEEVVELLGGAAGGEALAVGVDFEAGLDGLPGGVPGVDVALGVFLAVVADPGAALGLEDVQIDADFGPFGKDGFREEVGFGGDVDFEGGPLVAAEAVGVAGFCEKLLRAFGVVGVDVLVAADPFVAPRAEAGWNREVMTGSPRPP